MSDEKIFADGIIFKLPRQGAPDFVKGSLSFKVEDAVAWLQANAVDGWVNVKLNVSKGGKPYAELDTWKPNQDGAGAQNSNSGGGGGMFGSPPPGNNSGGGGQPEF